jgi:hypothetical protein
MNRNVDQVETDARHETAAPDPRDLPPPQAVKTAFEQLGELKAYLAYYLAAKADSMRLTLRRAGIFAALGLVGLFALGALVVTAVVLVCGGIAQLLTVAFGGRAWAGNLVTGTVVLALLGLGIWLGLRRVTQGSRERTVKNYELRRKRQRADFGHDVAQRAAEERHA